MTSSLFISPNVYGSKAFFLLFSIMLSGNIWATECTDRTFETPNVSLRLCQNYSNYNETRTILYRSRVQVLDSILSVLISEGKIPRKHVHINVLDPLLTYSYLNCSQGPKAYYIDGSGFLDLKEILSLIGYLGQSESTSFVYDPSKPNTAGLRAVLLKRASAFTFPGANAIINSSRVAWAGGVLRLCYQHDSLRYELQGKALPYPASSNLPVAIRDRFLFFSGSEIIVRNLEEELASIRLDQGTEGDLRTEVYKDWVNIGEQGGNSAFAYSYNRNRFYKVPANK